ncbi:hypothetical protein DRP07_00640 [Archaeoglobales archaeon]|nr:MAG: hypothetical protein DRP07_00640 [Archaeoglobales archaeon]
MNERYVDSMIVFVVILVILSGIYFIFIVSDYDILEDGYVSCILKDKQRIYNTSNGELEEKYFLQCRVRVVVHYAGIWDLEGVENLMFALNQSEVDLSSIEIGDFVIIESWRLKEV